MSALRAYGVVLFFVVLGLAALSAAAEPESCVACHQAIGVPKLTQPVKDFPQDIHAAKGFGCVACHGVRSHPVPVALVGECSMPVV